MSSPKGKLIKKKKYCRKKKIIRHANPLFDQWLLEWENEAEKCGSNMKFNYRRARHSLKLYPLPVYKGKECKLLAHFGDKICSMLDRRLQKHIDVNGPVAWDEVHQVLETPVKKKRARKKTENKHLAAPARNVVLPSVSSDTEVTSSGGCRGRAYVPSYRSGAYALLVALYNGSTESNSPGFMKKMELMEAAQHYSNASFKHASDGSHYTAWSSMSTLIKKNLVNREGNPSRYSLTAEGKILATRLLSATNPGMQVQSSSPFKAVGSNEDVITLSSRSCSPFSASSSPFKENRLSESSAPCNADMISTSSELPILQCDSLSTKNVSNLGNKKQKKNIDNSKLGLASVYSELLSQPATMCNSAGNLVFSYVSPLEMETPLKERAVACVEDDGFQGCLIKCRLSALLNSNLSYRLDDNRTAPLGYTYAYLSNDCAPDMSLGLLSPSQKESVSVIKKSALVAKTPFVSALPPFKGNISAVTSKAATISSSLESVRSSSSAKGTTKRTAPLPSIQRSDESATSIKRLCTGNLSSASSSPVVPQFTLPAGNYDIILCVDNAETNGGFTGCRHTTRDIIINELNKHKINYEIRKLHVGDFLWILKEHSSQPGSVNQPRELVLPYIVERKRMDDLASSIKDGRFKEQKFRLKQSGLSKPIYLVEEYGSQYTSLPEASCLQAITNTQVVDGFTVKITKDQQESAAFLTIMTRCLQSKYQGKSMRSLSLEDLQSQSSESSGSEVETAFVTFAELNRFSMKNRQLPVREMFAKHLLQLAGVSVDKAKAVVEKYGTPASLIAAYEGHGNSKECEQMLASLRCGKAGRNLGPTISTSICNLYTNLTLK